MKWRQQQLGKLLKGTKSKGQLSEEDHLPLEKFLSEYHDALSLEEDK